MNRSHRISARFDDGGIPTIECDLQTRGLADDRTVSQIQAEQMYIGGLFLRRHARARIERRRDSIRTSLAAAPRPGVLGDTRVDRGGSPFRPARFAAL